MDLYGDANSVEVGQAAKLGTNLLRKRTMSVQDRDSAIARMVTNITIANDKRLRKVRPTKRQRRRREMIHGPRPLRQTKSSQRMQKRTEEGGKQKPSKRLRLRIRLRIRTTIRSKQQLKAKVMKHVKKMAKASCWSRQSKSKT